MKISNYDKSKLVAKNKDISLYICKWGKNYRFVVEQDGHASQVGPIYSKQQEYINNAYDYASKTWAFIDNEILEEYPKQKTVTLSQSEIVSLNQALHVLKYSNSDYAEQSYYHIKTIIERLK